MVGNLFGHSFRVMSFGESHGEALGVVIDGLPSGIKVDEELLKSFLARRRPGASEVTSSRDEKDQPEILSGVLDGLTLGTPVAVIIRNQDARSKDYENLKPRKGHADEVWLKKYEHVDLRGGGRSSGRETLSRVIAGAFAKMAFKDQFKDTEVVSFTSSIGSVILKENKDKELLSKWDVRKGFNNDLVSMNEDELPLIRDLLLKAKSEGESYGGKISVKVFSPPESLGQPVFGKLKAVLTGSLMSVGAFNGVEIGEGFKAASLKGTDFHQNENVDVYGGVQGGISTGKTISLSISVKPTSSILDVAKKGRHDPCIVPRACVVAESMVWITLFDMLLQRKSEI